MSELTGAAGARQVSCPACGAAVVWSEASTYRPFCSARCKGIDLGAWASESYRVEAGEEPPPSDDTTHSPVQD